MTSNGQIHLVYTVGPGHCGSTLLNLCLDAHPEICAIGEIMQLNRQHPGRAGDQNSLTEPFWQRVAEHYRQTTGYHLSKVPFSFGQAALARSDRSNPLNANVDALQSMCAVARQTILADSSKNPMRLKALLMDPRLRVSVIELVRDARAVAYAYQRKGAGWARGLRKMLSFERATREIRMESPGTPWLKIRYEDLAACPRETLREICGFLNVAESERMLKPDCSAYAGIGGNRMRHKAFSAFSLDEVWRLEMGILSKLVTLVTMRKQIAENGYLE